MVRVFDDGGEGIAQGPVSVEIGQPIGLQIGEDCVPRTLREHFGERCMGSVIAIVFPASFKPDELVRRVEGHGVPHVLRNLDMLACGFGIDTRDDQIVHRMRDFVKNGVERYVGICVRLQRKESVA